MQQKSARLTHIPYESMRTLCRKVLGRLALLARRQLLPASWHLSQFLRSFLPSDDNSRQWAIYCVVQIRVSPRDHEVQGLARADFAMNGPAHLVRTRSSDGLILRPGRSADARLVMPCTWGFVLRRRLALRFSYSALAYRTDLCGLPFLSGIRATDSKTFCEATGWSKLQGIVAVVAA